MNERVTFIEQRQHINYIPEPNKFRFKPVGKLQFWQRWAFRALKRVGALVCATHSEVSYTTHTFDKGEFIERIYSQSNALSRQNRVPTKLLIGAEDFAELMHSKAIQDHICFEAPVAYQDERGYRILGLKVEIIPWMRGMVVMP